MVRPAQGAAELLSLRSRRAYQAAFGLLVVILVALAGLVLYAGTMVQTVFGHDALVLLDGAWKVLYGYRPHADFYTPLGPLNYVLPALAMTVCGPDAFAISLANLVFCLTCVLGAWFLLKSRLTPLHCVVLLALAAMGMLRCRQLFADYDAIGYAMLYNHQCYGLLILALPLLLLPRYAPTRRGDWQDAIAIGVLLGLVAFIKISYFVVAMPLLAVGCASRDWRWTARRLTGVAIGGFAVALPIFIYLRFDLLSIYRDLAMAYKARLGSVNLLSSIRGQTGLLEILTLCCVVLWAATQMPLARLLKILCAVAAIRLSEELIMATNGTNLIIRAHMDVPLFLAAIILPLEYAHRRWAARATSPWPFQRRHLAVYCSAGLLCAGLLGWTTALEVRSLCFACALRHGEVAQKDRFHSRSLRSLVVAEEGLPGDLEVRLRPPDALSVGPGTFGTYADKVNDGLDLLNTNADPSAVWTPSTSPIPFPLGLGGRRLRVPPGGTRG